MFSKTFELRKPLQYFKLSIILESEQSRSQKFKFRKNYQLINSLDKNITKVFENIKNTSVNHAKKFILNSYYLRDFIRCYMLPPHSIEGSGTHS